MKTVGLDCSKPPQWNFECDRQKKARPIPFQGSDSSCCPQLAWSPLNASVHTWERRQMQSAWFVSAKWATRHLAKYSSKCFIIRRWHRLSVSTSIHVRITISCLQWLHNWKIDCHCFDARRTKLAMMKRSIKTLKLTFMVLLLASPVRLTHTNWRGCKTPPSAHFEEPFEWQMAEGAVGFLCVRSLRNFSCRSLERLLSHLPLIISIGSPVACLPPSVILAKYADDLVAEGLWLDTWYDSEGFGLTRVRHLRR